MKHFFTTSLMAALFACLSITANAQTASVTVTNSTGCDLEVAVLGAGSTTSCSPHAIARATVPAGTTVTIPYIDQTTGLPTSAFNIGAAALYMAGPGTWTQANTPLSSLCYTTNAGTSPCGSYNLVLSGSSVGII